MIDLEKRQRIDKVRIAHLERVSVLEAFFRIRQEFIDSGVEVDGRDCLYHEWFLCAKRPMLGGLWMWFAHQIVRSDNCDDAESLESWCAWFEKHAGRDESDYLRDYAKHWHEWLASNNDEPDLGPA